MNGYTENELVKLFNRHRFICIRKDLWTSQCIFVFGNQSTKAPFHVYENASSFPPVINSNFDNFKFYHPKPYSMNLVAPFGFYGWGNIGDEATLQGFARLMAGSPPKPRVWVASQNPRHTARA